MPVVNTNTIKEWFSNLKKPPQEQFWAWLDSFRHKEEKIPLDDVEGLKNSLRLKADLVDGIVPENQLPFSVKTSEVLLIGQITATENTVKVWVHSSGMNRIRLNGVIYERAFANPFTYTAVINFSKILIVYALPIVGLFFLAEGAEAVEAIEPELPEGAFVIRRIVVNQTGQIIEAPIADGLKYNEEDGWRNIMLTEPLTVLPYTFDLRSSYWINSQIVGATIGGIRNALIDRNASPSWDGKEFWIYNNTGDDLPLNSATVIEEDVFLFANAITLKDKHSCKVKIRRDALEIVGVLGGEPFDPTSLENSIANKLDKPTDDGSWVVTKSGSVYSYTSASSFGQNISNANLSNISARVFTQGNEFTWNTAGLKYYLKNLVDKTNQAAYSKVVIVHPTTGETVTRDFADPSATTLAVQNATTTQKTAMRTALLGTATPANPVLTECSPRFIKKGVLSTIDLIGLNLILLDPTFIWIEKSDSSKIYATNFFNVTNAYVTTVWDIPADLPNGNYSIKIQNGVTTQGLSTAVFTVVDSIAYTYLPNSDWKRKLRLKTDGNEASLGGGGLGTNNSSDNYIKTRDSDVSGYDSANSNTIPAILFKSENIFLGNKDWDISVLVKTLQGSGQSDFNYPHIGLTETTHSDFVNILSVISNTCSFENGRSMLLPTGGGFDLNAPGTESILYLSKVGNMIYYRLSRTGSYAYYQVNIDTTKNYALFIRASAHGVNGTATMAREHTITARIMN